MSMSHTNVTFRLFTTLGVLGLATAAPAQSRQVPAPRQVQPVVLNGATIHTMAGQTYEGGHVVFEGGVISAVGEGSTRMSGAEVFELDGYHIYPGLISTDTTLGLIESGSVAVTVDTSELGEVTPEVRAAVAVNPDSDLIPVTRANGILTALVWPRSGLVSGWASLMRLDGWTWEEMAIDPVLGLAINWPQTEPRAPRWPGAPSIEDQRRRIRENLGKLDELFDHAEAYLAAREADATQAPDLRLESLRRVLSGAAPVLVRASSRGQIEAAVAWAARRGVQIVIVGAADAVAVAPLLREHDVPVIVTGLHRLPRRRDVAYDEQFTLPARLAEAGISFAIASGSGSAHERNLNHNVATSVAYGLDHDRALASITIDAARILGVDKWLGSLETGKAATLIITDGDPLEITTDVHIAFMDGRRIDLGSRHKDLNRKYREKYRQRSSD